MNHTQIAISIVIGSLLVAVAVFFKFTSPSGGVSNVSYSRADNAHTYGKVNSPIRIVEFSDFECPFCSRLHPTLKRIVDESDGEAVWEYRHLPLGNHKNALYAAVVSECVSAVGGNDKFWQFSDQLFAESSSLGTVKINDLALSLGLTPENIDSCVNDDDIKARITNDIEVANLAGARGTPHSLIIMKGKAPKSISGALPYEHWISQINNLKNE